MCNADSCLPCSFIWSTCDVNDSRTMEEVRAHYATCIPSVSLLEHHDQEPWHQCQLFSHHLHEALGFRCEEPQHPLLATETWQILSRSTSCSP